MARSPHHRGPLIHALPLVLLLLGALSACGTTGHVSTPGTGTHVPGAGTPGSATLNGCALQQGPTGLPPADVLVSQAGIQGATPTPSQELAPTGFALRRGQAAEFRLSATIQWGVTQSADGILASPQPQDWYDTTDATCVWRYTAVQPGTVKLSFTGGPVCPPNAGCPAYAAIARYEITVS
ncbi:MAG TPA: hypothetical protein VFY89_02645 [Ktedonobacterales bacterium]